jgi:hypothetical protein
MKVGLADSYESWLVFKCQLILILFTTNSITLLMTDPSTVCDHIIMRFIQQIMNTKVQLTLW